MASTSNKILSSSVGRRKRATAFARLHSGGGDMSINGKSYKDYFPILVQQQRLESVFKTVGMSKYGASIKVNGGGLAGQVDASALAISRALVKLKELFRKPLRDAGLLTRDSRERQRRMIGMGGKSRRKKQSPKR